MRSVVTPRRPKHSPRDGRLTIGSLSRAVGVPVSTLRTWEHRFGVPIPERKPSGHRLYPLESVAHLRALKRALDQGRRPAEVMGLSTRELEALVAAAWLVPEGEADTRPPAPSISSVPGGSAAPDIETLFEAARRLDKGVLVASLRAEWAARGPMGFLTQCAAPFLERLGVAWEAGTIDVRHEHFASACVGDFLREAKRPWDERARGPVVAMATLSEERHDLGLLMASVVLAVNGWRALYLGPDTPSEELVALAKDAPVRAIAISVSLSKKRTAPSAVRALRRALPARVALWVGGAGAPPAIAGVVVVRDLDSLERMIGRAEITGTAPRT